MNLQFRKIIASSLALLSFVPMVALAEDNTTPAPTTAASTLITVPVAGKNFCENLTKVQQKLADQVGAREGNQLASFTERQTKVARVQSDVDAKRATARTTADGRREKAEAGIKTDTGKAFAVSVEAAIAARKAAVDAAVAAYRTGLEQALSAQKTSADTATATFKTALAAAVAKATTDCANTVDPTVAGKTFNQAVKDARTALQATRKGINTDNTAIKALRVTRDAAIKKAEADFKTAITKARGDMKATMSALRTDKKAMMTGKGDSR